MFRSATKKTSFFHSSSLGRFFWVFLALGSLNAQNRQPPQEKPREPIASLTLSFVGEAQFPSLADRDKLSINNNFVYEELAPLLHGDDGSFVDIAAPLLGSSTDKNLGFAQPSDLEALIKAGFDVFSLANDHLVQASSDIINQTETQWQALWQRYPWINYTGLNSNTQRFEPKIFSKKNKKIAFFALTYLASETPSSTARVNVVDFEDERAWQAVQSQIQRIRNQVDVIIVSYHGKHISNEKHALWHTALRQLVDAGAHIVWNHYPFNGQEPVEFYQDKIIIHNTGVLLSEKPWAVEESQEGRALTLQSHSVLYRVILHWYNEEEKGIIQRFIIEPIPLNNYQDPQKGRVVFRSDDERFLARMPQGWQKHYSDILEEWQRRVK